MLFVSVPCLETVVSVPLPVVHDGLLRVLEFFVVFLLWLPKSRLGSSSTSRTHTHLWGPRSVMDESEDEVGAAAIPYRIHLTRPHPIITDWQKLVAESRRGCRTPILALVGGAQTGKTWKCMTLFGSRTVLVSCAGQRNGVLPVVDLERHHMSVLWKDIRVDQLLHNREVFASGRPALSDSQVFVTGANHPLDRRPRPLAMMLCANFLPMTVSEGLSADDALWMEHNVWKVTLEPGTRWWVDS